MLLTQIAALDEALERHRATIGADFTGYRNHCYRMANFCAALSSRDDATLRKIGIAAAYHDIAIWTHGTWDYLPPSIDLMRSEQQWQLDIADIEQIAAMILEHHKISPYRGEHGALVEAFRKADLVDVSLGLLRMGLPRAFVAEVRAQYPNHGFHAGLLKQTGKRLLTDPLNPMPMMRR